MAKGDEKLIVTSRDVARLLATVGAPAADLDSAVERGLVTRTKTSGQWLYATDASVLSSGEKAVLNKADDLLDDWFIGSNAWLGQTVAKRLRAPVVTRDAAELLIREAFRSGRIRALGLVSDRFLPYVAAYRAEEEELVVSVVEETKERVARTGLVHPANLDAHGRRTTVDGWRGLLLRHAEYLGLGHIEDQSLRGWEVDR